MLSVTKLHNTKENLILKEFSIKQPIETVTSIVKNQYKDKTFEIIIDKSTPAILADTDKFQQIMTNLIENAAKYVKVGGTLIYSTCTIQDSENIDVVNEFLQKNKNFELVPIKEVNVDLENQEKGYMKIYPNVHNMDGFFISKLIRVR